VYLLPGAEMVVSAGARLLVYGDRRRPVTFAPAPRPERSLFRRDRPSEPERSGRGPGSSPATRRASRAPPRSPLFGPRGFAPSVSGAAWGMVGSLGEEVAWGEVRVEGGGRLVATHAIFTGGGGLGPADRVRGGGRTHQESASKQ
jgi:hypothetical protein